MNKDTDDLFGIGDMDGFGFDLLGEEEELEFETEDPKEEPKEEDVKEEE